MVGNSDSEERKLQMRSAGEERFLAAQADAFAGANAGRKSRPAPLEMTVMVLRCYVGALRGSGQAKAATPEERSAANRGRLGQGRRGAAT